MADLSNDGDYQQLSHANENQQMGRGSITEAVDENDHRQKFVQTEAAFQNHDLSYDEQKEVVTVQLTEPNPASESGAGNELPQDGKLPDAVRDEIRKGLSQETPEETAAAEFDSKALKRIQKCIDKNDSKLNGVHKKVEELDDKRDIVRQKRKLVTKRIKNEKYIKNGRLDEHGYREKKKDHKKRAGSLVDMGIPENAGRLKGEQSDIYKRGGHFHSESYRKATKKDNEKYFQRKNNKKLVKERKSRLRFKKAKNSLDSKDYQDDEDSKALQSGMYRTSRLFKDGGRKLATNVFTVNSKYVRLEGRKRQQDILEAKQQLLEDRKRLIEREKRLQEEKKSKAAGEAKREQKKRIKKEMAHKQHEESLSFFERSKTKIFIGKKKVAQRLGKIRKLIAILSTGIGIIIFLWGVAIVIMMIIYSGVDGGVQIMSGYVSMNDYGTMTSVNSYFTEKCSVLEEMFKNQEKKSEFEEKLKREYDVDIYEYVYDLDEVTYDHTALLAYLSAVYGTFTLNDVKADLDDIFEKMFTVTSDIKIEKRQIYNDQTKQYEWLDKYICYVHLRTKTVEEIVNEKMTDEQKKAYTGYKESDLGQQVMNPVIKTDWRNLITSPFGWRYHPIDHVRKMHNGVDIGIPEGTQIYSAVNGVVKEAGYNDSEGNHVAVQDDNGYTVIFMHMSSYSVTAGQKVKAGEFVGLSGNTGKSTGAHLHISVKDSDGNYLNPVNLIPQTWANQ